MNSTVQQITTLKHFIIASTQFKDLENLAFVFKQSAYLDYRQFFGTSL